MVVPGAVKLLVIEDEEKIASSLQRGLEEQHYKVDLAFDGASGLERAMEGDYQLIVLDVMLPGMDGLEVLDRLRQAQQRTPVLLLTALNRVHDRVVGLRSGADDYLVKPFAFAELLARVEAILRRTAPVVPVDYVEVDGLKLRYSNQSVEREGRTLELTGQDFKILCLLIENRGRLVTRKQLAEKIWGIDFECETNVVDVAIRRLRQKLDEPFEKKLIQTVRGAGYIFVDSKSPK